MRHSTTAFVRPPAFNAEVAKHPEIAEKIDAPLGLGMV
jgi:hypothetical protein